MTHSEQLSAPAHVWAAPPPRGYLCVLLEYVHLMTTGLHPRLFDTGLTTYHLLWLFHSAKQSDT